MRRENEYTDADYLNKLFNNSKVEKCFDLEWWRVAAVKIKRLSFRVKTNLFLQSFKVKISIGKIHSRRRAKYSNSWNLSCLWSSKSSLVFHLCTNRLMVNHICLLPLCESQCPDTAQYLVHFPEQSRLAWNGVLNWSTGRLPSFRHPNNANILTKFWN